MCLIYKYVLNTYYGKDCSKRRTKQQTSQILALPLGCLRSSREDRKGTSTNYYKVLLNEHYKGYLELFGRN